MIVNETRSSIRVMKVNDTSLVISPSTVSEDRIFSTPVCVVSVHVYKCACLCVFEFNAVIQPSWTRAGTGSGHSKPDDEPRDNGTEKACHAITSLAPVLLVNR